MLSPPDLETLDRVAAHLVRARSVLFITGAGLSADSGLPTYRGVGGLYEQEVTEDGYAIEDILSGPMFEARPALTWKYLRQIEQACRVAQPNRGHEVIAELEHHLPRVWTLTQNVDGFHHRAGSHQVIPIHGQLHDLWCPVCTWRATVANYDGLAELPRCDQCRGVLRPDVVLFGESLPEAGLHELRRQVEAGFDLVFSVGTSSLFPYIAYPVESATARAKPTVEINPGTTRLSRIMRYRIMAGAAETLAALWARYEEKLTGA